MSQYTPEFIAQSFVNQYYEILYRSPGDLHKFYLPNASFAFQDVSQKTDNVVGFEQIRDRVARLNLHGTVVDVASIDAQRFETTKILVVVTGTFTVTSLPRTFVNTFILVGTNNAYFVSNSVFRFISPIQIAQIAEPSQSLSPQRNATDILKSVIEVAATSSPTIHPSVSREGTSSIELEQPEEKVEALIEEDLPSQVEDELEQGKTEELDDVQGEVEETVPSYEEITTARAEAIPEVEVETSSATKSYSDIVKRLATKSSTENKPNTTHTPGYRVVRSATAIPSPNATTTSIDSVAVVRNNKLDVPSGSKNHGTGTSGQQLYAVYIAPLPEGISEQQIAEAFTIFGKVVQVDVTRGRKYGFVKFESVTSMQAALDYEGVVELNGVRIQIEEKTSPKSKVEGVRRRERNGDRGGGGEKGGPRQGKSPDFKKSARKEGGDKGDRGSGKQGGASHSHSNSTSQPPEVSSTLLKGQRK